MRQILVNLAWGLEKRNEIPQIWCTCIKSIIAAIIKIDNDKIISPLKIDKGAFYVSCS